LRVRRGQDPTSRKFVLRRRDAWRSGMIKVGGGVRRCRICDPVHARDGPMQFHGQAIGDPGEERGIVRTFTIEPFAFPPQAAALREQVRAIVADPLA